MSGGDQLTFEFDAPSAPGKARRRRSGEDPAAPVEGQQDIDDAVAPPPEPELRMFEDRIGLDVHLHTPWEVQATITGGEPDWVTYQVDKIIGGGVQRPANRKLVLPATCLDRLLCFLAPHDVVLDAAALCVARAMWAQALGWKPLRVHRSGKRLLASSVRWPTGWKVVDAPWIAVVCLEALGVPLRIEDSAKALLLEKMGKSGQKIATAGLAGSAVLLETDRPELLEALELPALAYVNGPGSGKYRMPILVADPLLREASIEVPKDLEEAIKRATAPVKPLPARESFPRQLYPFQATDLAKGMRILEHTGGVLLAGDMGSGKLLAVDSMVFGVGGPYKIGDVEVGDEVLGSDGKPHRVTGVFPQGVRDMYRVTFTDGTSVRAGAEHLWAVHSALQKQKGRPGRVLTTLEILADGLRDGAGNLRHYIPVVSGPLELDHPGARPVPGYTLGALLGGGSIVDGSPGLCDAEAEVLALVTADLEGEGLPGLSIKPVAGSVKDYTITDPTQRGNRLTTALRELGLWGKRAWEKSVPEQYLYAPADVRLAVLQGLMDTDGSVSDKRSRGSSEFGSTSEQLVDDVRWLVQSLGGTARKSGPRRTKYPHNGEKREGRLSWRLSVALPNDVVPFRCGRKAAERQPRTKYLPTRGIVSIEPDGADEAVCISVDAPDSLYLTDHAVVTHNTTISLAAVDHLDAWPLLVVAPLAAFSTWERQIQELGRTVLLCTNPIAEDAEAIKHVDCAVVSYDRLHRFVGPLESGGFAAIVADEAQRIRTPGSKRSRALRALASSVPLRIGLSGTPVTNRAEDVLPLGAFLIPGEWRPRMNGRDLAELYPGEDPLESLADHLGTMMVRRRIDEVGQKLPGRDVKRVPVTLSPEQRRALHEMEEEIRREKEEGDLGSRVHIFARLQKMRQIVNAPSAAGLPGPNAKVAAAVDLALEYSEMGRKSVVFVADRAAWREVGQKLDAEGVRWTGIWGSTSVDDRIRNEHNFHNDDEIRVFVGTLAACAESLTLSPTATVTIFAALSYSPSAIAQAAARTYRMNQTNDVDEIYLHAVAPGGTLDDRMHQILEEKRQLIAQIVDRQEHSDPAEKVSMEDLLFMLTGDRDPEAAERIEAKMRKVRDNDEATAKEAAEAERRKDHARKTIHRRKTGLSIDDGAAAATKEEWEASHGHEAGWLDHEEELLEGDLDDGADWEELLDADEDDE